jgi:hypothetical protein
LQFYRCFSASQGPGYCCPQERGVTNTPWHAHGNGTEWFRFTSGAIACLFPFCASMSVSYHFLIQSFKIFMLQMPCGASCNGPFASTAWFVWLVFFIYHFILPKLSVSHSFAMMTKICNHAYFKPFSWRLVEQTALHEFFSMFNAW